MASVDDVLAGTERWALVHADCTDPLAGCDAALETGSVHHMITDPPYEADAHTKGKRIRRYMGGGQYGVRSEPIEAFDQITPELRSAVGVIAGRVVTRWSLVFCQVEAVQTWADVLTVGGLIYKRSCVWIKPDGQPQLTGDRPGMGYETIVTAHTPGRSRWNAGGRIGVYSFTRHQDHGPHHLKHPTVKPLPLMEALIRDFTDPDEIVIDPFAGSGTTGVACIRLGRRFIGWERDEKFHGTATRRLETTREQPELVALDRFAHETKQRRQQTTLDLDAPFDTEE